MLTFCLEMVKISSYHIVLVYSRFDILFRDGVHDRDVTNKLPKLIYLYNPKYKENCNIILTVYLLDIIDFNYLHVHSTVYY